MYAIGEGLDKNPVVVTLTIPAELQSAAGLTKDNISVITRGPVSPGGRLDEVDGDPTVPPTEEVNDYIGQTDNDGTVVINLDRIDRGGSITLTYELENDDDDSGLITLSTTAARSR